MPNKNSEMYPHLLQMCLILLLVSCSCGCLLADKNDFQSNMDDNRAQECIHTERTKPNSLNYAYLRGMVICFEY